jgi:hypothetical protein
MRDPLQSHKDALEIALHNALTHHGIDPANPEQVRARVVAIQHNMWEATYLVDGEPVVREVVGDGTLRVEECWNCMALGAVN